MTYLILYVDTEGIWYVPLIDSRKITKMMRKMVLIPYDKYERLLTGQVSQPKPVNTTDTYTEQVTIHSPQQDNCHSNTQDSTTEDLLSSLPLPLRSRAGVILNHLTKHTNLQWNDKGEITISGQLLKGSNITDLIKIQLKDYKSFHPIGAEVFSQLIQESNVPQSVLTQARRCQIGSGKTPHPPGKIPAPPGKIPPPPGKPVRRK